MIKNALKKIYRASFLRWWLMISLVYSTSSVCPCCGKPSAVCSSGLGISTLIGFLLISFWSMGKNVWRKLSGIIRKIIPVRKFCNNIENLEI